MWVWLKRKDITMITSSHLVSNIDITMNNGIYIPEADMYNGYSLLSSPLQLFSSSHGFQWTASTTHLLALVLKEES